MTIPQNNFLALILDGVVQQTMLVDDRMAAILLSEPLVLDIPYNGGPAPVYGGFSYNPDTGEFTPPEHWIDPVKLLELDEGLADQDDII